MQILLVEDNPSLARGLKVALNQEGFTVNSVANGQFALDIIATETPDAVILDLGLPDMDGLEVLAAAKKMRPNLAVLILTARDQIADKVQGLESGADDYLAKPFDMLELIARLKVMERRLFGTQEPAITIGEVELSLKHHELRINGKLVELSRREYMLAKTLMESAGRVITRATLEARMYNWEDEVLSNALEVHIHNLRKKLGSSLIKTVRGVGYMVPKK